VKRAQPPLLFGRPLLFETWHISLANFELGLLIRACRDRSFARAA
jgi:hypothetical protein